MARVARETGIRKSWHENGTSCRTKHIAADTGRPAEFRHGAGHGAAGGVQPGKLRGINKVV